MSSNECECAVPVPAAKRDDLDKVTIYGTWFNAPGENGNPKGPPPLQHHVLAYGYAFQGHCYRLAMPAEYRFEYYEKKLVRYRGPVVPPVDPCNPGQRDLGEAMEVDLVAKLPREPKPAEGCGFDAKLGYRMWLIDRTTPVQRIERRHGLAEELLLDFNLPGRPPSTLTYSAKTAIAARAGKVHE